MNDKIRLILDWALPILCLVNFIVYWENTTMAMAWVVAFTGWSANLINRYKKV